MVAPLAAKRCSKCGRRNRPMSGNVCLNCACGQKTKKKSKRYYDKGCKLCGHKNNINIEQKKVKCVACRQIY